MSPAAVHAAAVAAAFAAVVAVAYHWDGIARWIDARLAARLATPGNHARLNVPDALPSPGASPAGRGQSQEPGGAPVPPEEATRTRYGAMWPGAGPAPVPPVQGAGQHPFAPVVTPFPDGNIGILGADGAWHIRPLAWQPGVRETGGMPALVRPARSRYEAWQDSAVNQ